MNAKLTAIADEAATNLKALVKENEDKLLEAWNACESEAQENETTPKFKIGLAITLDIEADKMATALTFGVRYKSLVECEIPDPEQTKLEFEEKPAVMIHGPDGLGALLTPKQAAAALKKMSNRG
jgi:hypothetical protein